MGEKRDQIRLFPIRTLPQFDRNNWQSPPQGACPTFRSTLNDANSKRRRAPPNEAAQSGVRGSGLYVNCCATKENGVTGRWTVVPRRSLSRLTEQRRAS